MNDGAGWAAYGRQSYRVQFADGVMWRRRSTRRSRLVRVAMQPGPVSVSWPGWEQVSRSVFSARRV